jgi:Zn-dependent protease/CBS domain-containing protein
MPGGVHSTSPFFQDDKMGWSISLGRVAGTEVRIHLTFFLLVAWFALSAGARGGQPAALDAVLFILAVFACVLAHEFGHVLTARAYGIGTRDITLLPIGGVASIERMPEKPGQELVIALAGPAVNLVIFAVLVMSFGTGLTTASLNEPIDVQPDFVTRLALVNAMLFLFNLLPAFPLDGGRVLRALLTYRLGRARATRISAIIGQVIAFGLGFLGLFGNPLLIFIALFIFLAAQQESYAVELSEATKAAPLQPATVTAFAMLDTNSTVGQAVEKLLSTSQKEFPVTDGGGRMRGVLTRDGMIRALAATGPDTPVIDLMERDVQTVNQRAPLADAVKQLQAGRQSLVGVVDDADRVVGLVTLENLAEYMMVAQANEGWRASARNRPQAPARPAG